MGSGSNPVLTTMMTHIGYLKLLLNYLQYTKPLKINPELNGEWCVRDENILMSKLEPFCQCQVKFSEFVNCD